MTFVVSKFLWLVVAPGNLLLLILLAGVLRMAASRGRRGFTLVAAATFGFLAIAMLPIGSWLTAPLENRFPAVAAPARVDGIVILGGSIDPGLSLARGQVAIIAAAARVTEAVALARRFPAARVLISGGDGSVFPGAPPGTLSEAAATRDFLVELGVAGERIELERTSRNTYENAVMSYQAARPKAGETWLLLTSAMHMPRAVGCFRRAGWTITPYPVDYRTAPRIAMTPGLLLADNLVLVNFAVKEWLGLIAYYGLGRTDALFPAPG